MDEDNDNNDEYEDDHNVGGNNIECNFPQPPDPFATNLNCTSGNQRPPI